MTCNDQNSLTTEAECSNPHFKDISFPSPKEIQNILSSRTWHNVGEIRSFQEGISRLIARRKFDTKLMNYLAKEKKEMPLNLQFELKQQINSDANEIVQSLIIDIECEVYGFPIEKLKKDFPEFADQFSGIGSMIESEGLPNELGNLYFNQILEDIFYMLVFSKEQNKDFTSELRVKGLTFTKLDNSNAEQELLATIYRLIQEQDNYKFLKKQEKEKLVAEKNGTKYREKKQAINDGKLARAVDMFKWFSDAVCLTIDADFNDIQDDLDTDRMRERLKKQKSAVNQVGGFTEDGFIYTNYDVNWITPGKLTHHPQKKPMLISRRLQKQLDELRKALYKNPETNPL